MKKSNVSTQKAIVINNKKYAQGTLTVRVSRTTQHPLYEKIIRLHKNYTVHYENKEFIEVGAEVEIVQCRPMSKLKRWKIVKVGGKEC